jgi:nucleoside-diphosphate-sugar epimerase
LFDSVVTGSAGFIGSQLTESLLARGERVLGIDSLDPYYSTVVKRRNLAAALEHPRFTFRSGDLRLLRLERHLVRETRVYHLAAQPGVRASWGRGFERYVRNNVLATQSLLESVGRAGHRTRVVYAGSSSVYGAQPPGAMSEDALPNPISPYGMTKLAGEHLGRSYARAKGIAFVALRFFTVYGPRQRPDMAFHRFFRAALEGRPIDVYGTGRQWRDFTYVDDIVRGIVSAGAEEGASGVYNLGRGSPVRLLQAIRLVRSVSGREVAIRRLPRAAGDPEATWADIRRARRELGYRPRVDLADGLRRQWDWQGGSTHPLPPG